MPRGIGYGKEFIHRKTRKLIKEGRPPKQAYAIANSIARRMRAKFRKK